MITAGDFRNGVTFEMEGNVYQIIEFQHVKPGKGAAFVRTKIRNVIAGSVIEKTFNPSDKFPTAFVERKDMEYSYFYTCGPEPMLKAIYNTSTTSGQFSFEERMGCGFGACMGCSCKTVTGYKRICKDGPVLEKEEILWAD